MQHSIRTDLRAGDLGRLIALHGTAYEKEAHHFGLAFEAFVAASVAEFVIENDARGTVWLAEDAAGSLIGSIAMVDRGSRGQLRWLVIAPEARGIGLGARLIELALDEATSRRYRQIYLETVHGLDASMTMYRQRGFTIVDESEERLWHPSQRTKVTMALEL